MSGKGNCYDNSMVEMFCKSIKAELIWHNCWATRRQAEGAIFHYILMGFRIRVAAIHRWVAKAPWHLNERPHKLLGSPARKWDKTSHKEDGFIHVSQAPFDGLTAIRLGPSCSLSGLLSL